MEPELMDNKENHIYSDTVKKLTGKMIHIIPLLFHSGLNKDKE